jgi:hypothetical protein
MAMDYVKTIQEKSASDLLEMYRQLKVVGKISGWAPGKALEHIILRCFELSPAVVSHPFTVEIENKPVEQIDGVVWTDRFQVLVESKHQRARINIESIAKIKSQLSRRPSNVMGSVFSMNGFTESATFLTGYMLPLNVLLWEGPEIELMLTDAQRHSSSPVEALNTKYKFAVEKAMPDYNITAGYM